LLDEAGSGLEHAIRLDQFPTSKAVIDPYHVVRRELLPEPRPVSTSVVVDNLMFADCSIEVEMVAIRPEPGFAKQVVDVRGRRRPDPQADGQGGGGAGAALPRAARGAGRRLAVSLRPGGGRWRRADPGGPGWAELRRLGSAPAVAVRHGAGRFDLPRGRGAP